MKQYTITQFADPHLAQYGYSIISNGEAAIVDPPRDIRPILELLEKEQAVVIAIIETHPHADFVSGHLELHMVTGAPIRVSALLGADYSHVPFDTGDTITLGTVTLEAINTPGHSPDSISILVRDEQGVEQVLFSGDTLFVGDVGRPDLRESSGNMQAKREELAGMMYETVQTILKKLPDHVTVYPAHGAGTLCGKALRDAPSTTIGEEKASNPAFEDMTKDAFVAKLTEGQPFIPQYFPFEVGLNKAGAPPLDASLQRIEDVDSLPADMLIVDTRSRQTYDAGHVPKSLHIDESGLRFETWLGTIVAPDEKFVVVVENTEARNRVLRRIAAIGYEQNVYGVYVGPTGTSLGHLLKLEEIRQSPTSYTIIDVRQTYENEQDPLFAHAQNIPLNELRNRIQEVPTDKPVAVHCAGGYRSMIAQSILSSQLSVPVYDIGEDIHTFRP